MKHKHHGDGGRGGRRRGRRRQSDPPAVTAEDLRSFFAGNTPDDWFTDPVDVTFDRDEIIVTGRVGSPKVADGDDPAKAADARIAAFREDTREQRISIAQRAEEAFERKVSWQIDCNDSRGVFTRASVPVMSRLHFEDRQVLDTLIDAGVARSRSDALAWCVQLVADNEAEWIAKLREAMTEVEELRAQGPDSRS